MKLIVVLLGLATMFMGVIPILNENKIMPSGLGFIPAAGVGYQVIIILLGISMFLYGMKKKYVKVKEK